MTVEESVKKDPQGFREFPDTRTGDSNLPALWLGLVMPGIIEPALPILTVVSKKRK